MVVLKEYKPSLKNNVGLAFLLTILMTVSLIFANVTKVNFAQLLENPIPLLETIRVSTNGFVFFISYTGLLVGAIVFFNSIVSLIYNFVTTRQLTKAEEIV
jgi:uncharacterized membrane protein